MGKQWERKNLPRFPIVSRFSRRDLETLAKQYSIANQYGEIKTIPGKEMKKVIKTLIFTPDYRAALIIYT